MEIRMEISTKACLIRTHCCFAIIAVNISVADMVWTTALLLLLAASGSVIPTAVRRSGTTSTTTRLRNALLLCMATPMRLPQSS